MVDYPTDLRLNRDKDIELNDGNDLATVGGVGNLNQSVAISAGDAIDKFVGDRLDGTSIALLEERLERYLDDNPMIDSIDDVILEEYDRRDNSVTVVVEVTGDENFEIEV